MPAPRPLVIDADPTTAPEEVHTGFSVFDVSAGLRERGWQVPAYTFPAHREDLAALRVVVRDHASARR